MATIIRDKIKQPSGKDFKLLDAIDVEYLHGEESTSVQEFLTTLDDSIEALQAQVNETPTTETLENYYTKSEIDNFAYISMDDAKEVLAEKANVYTRTEIGGDFSESNTLVKYIDDQNQAINASIQGLSDSKADASNVYTKNEVYTKDESYNKTEVDGIAAGLQSSINAKANSADVYTKGEVDDKEAALSALINGLSTDKADKIDLNNYYTKSEVYTRAETDSAINTKIQQVGGSSAAAVKAELDEYIAKNDALVQAASDKGAANEASIADLQANKLDASALEPYAKTSDLTTGLASKADKSVVDSLVNSVTGENGLSATVSTLSNGLAATNALVNQHGTDIGNINASLNNKLEASDLADYAKTSDVNTALANKANASEVYKIDEIDDQFEAISGRIEAIVEDKPNYYTKAEIGDRDLQDGSQTAYKTVIDTAVDRAVDAVIGEGAHEDLNTIGEISAALKNNKDIIDTLNQAIGSKATSDSVNALSALVEGNRQSISGINGSITNINASLENKLESNDLTTYLETNKYVNETELENYSYSKEKIDDSVDALQAGIDANTSAFANYYQKSETYNKEAIDNMISALTPDAEGGGIAGLVTAVADNTKNIEENAKNIGINADAIEALGAELQGHATSLNELIGENGSVAAAQQTANEALEAANTANVAIGDTANPAEGTLRKEIANLKTSIGDEEGQLGARVNSLEDGLQAANSSIQNLSDREVFTSANYYTKEQVGTLSTEEGSTVISTAAGQAKTYADSTFVKIDDVVKTSLDDSDNPAASKVIKDAIDALDAKLEDAVGADDFDIRHSNQTGTDENSNPTYEETNIALVDDKITFVINSYTKEETNTLIQNVTGGESAGDVKNALETYIDEANTRFGEAEDRIEAAEAALNDKVNESTLSNYYTKAEIGNIAEGKQTIVETSNAYTDKQITDIKGTVPNQHATLGALYTLIGEKASSAEMGQIRDKANANEAAIANQYTNEQIHNLFFTKTETRQEIADQIETINGGESAGEVLAKLNGHIATSDERFGRNEEAIAGNTEAINEVKAGVSHILDNGTGELIIKDTIANGDNIILRVDSEGLETTKVKARIGEVDNLQVGQNLTINDSTGLVAQKIVLGDKDLGTVLTTLTEGYETVSNVNQSQGSSIENIQTSISDINAALGNKVDNSTLNNYVTNSALTEEIKALTDADGVLEEAIKANKDAIDALDANIENNTVGAEDFKIRHSGENENTKVTEEDNLITFVVDSYTKAEIDNKGYLTEIPSYDSALDNNSENAVQNKVISNKFDAMDALISQHGTSISDINTTIGDENSGLIQMIATAQGDATQALADAKTADDKAKNAQDAADEAKGAAKTAQDTADAAGAQAEQAGTRAEEAYVLADAAVTQGELSSAIDAFENEADKKYPSITDFQTIQNKVNGDNGLEDKIEALQAAIQGVEQQLPNLTPNKDKFGIRHSSKSGDQWENTQVTTESGQITFIVNSYTKEEIDETIDSIVGEGAHETLDTIGEISKALKDNADIIDTLATKGDIQSVESSIQPFEETFQFPDDNSSNLLISDKEGHLIARLDGQGLTTTALNINDIIVNHDFLSEVKAHVESNNLHGMHGVYIQESMPANVPIGSIWINPSAEGFTPSQIGSLPPTTSEDENKVLAVINQAPTWVNIGLDTDNEGLLEIVLE